MNRGEMLADLNLPRAVVISAIERDNYRTITLELELSLDADPGQFVMVWVPGFDEKPFSLVSADPVRIMVTRVGPFTQEVHDLVVGGRLWIRGPFGRGFDPNHSHRRVALVGGGYGVAPLLWLARSPQLSDSEVHVIVGAGRRDDLLYLSRFEALPPGTGERHIHVTTEDGSQGIQGWVTDALGLLCEDGPVDGIFGCGPHGMLAALQQFGEAHHVETQLSWEAYMRCAIGICGACEHEGKVLCLDGPVLTSAHKTRS